MISLLFSLLVSVSAQAKTTKIAVIDTGIDKIKAPVKLCDTGHKDFTGEGLNDIRGHGSVISKLINDVAKEEDYCQVIIKYASIGEKNNPENMIKALEYALTLDIDYVNISAGGAGYDSKEKKTILKLLNKGIVVVAAAGNDGQNLDVDCYYFPACYDSRIIVVGALDNKGARYSDSNHGKVVDFYFSGEDILFDKQFHSGTSMAAASVSGNLIVLKKKFREVWLQKKKKQFAKQ